MPCSIQLFSHGDRVVEELVLSDVAAPLGQLPRMKQTAPIRTSDGHWHEMLNARPGQPIIFAGK